MAYKIRYEDECARANKMPKKNVTEVVNSGLCTSCGVCQGVCPLKVITFQLRKGLLLPIVGNYCNLCGLCYAVCSGREIDYDNLNIELFRQVPNDVLMGNYLKIGVGHSTNDTLRYKASSGGVVTSLLLLALEEGIIDAAVILDMNKDNPLQTKPIIARTREEIVSATGSKYTSGPIGKMIPEMIKNEGRYAVVGLPCAIAALRKAELYIKKLRERIVLHFGLFCQTMISYKGLDFWFRVNKINFQDVIGLSYRGYGWPGGMTVKLKDGENKFYPLPLYWRFLQNFTPKRCTLCTDALADFADISFGDAWLPEFAGDKKGTSIFVVRSQVGKELIELAIRKGKIEVGDATRDMVLQSQRKTLKFKKQGYSYRAKILSCLARKVPIYTGGFIQDGHSSYIRSINFYLKRWLFQRKVLWPLIFYWAISVYPWLLRIIRASLSRILTPFLQLLVILNRLTPRYLNRSKAVRNVLIINQADMLNKGDAAILAGTIKLVNKSFPNASIAVVSHTYEVDKSRCPVKVVPSYQFARARATVALLSFAIFYRLTSSLKIFRLPIFRRVANETLIEYAKADLVIHRGGDNLTEDYGIPYLYFESILIGILLRKPIIILGESIGPFNIKTSKCLAKAILNNVDVIVTREKKSVENLHKLAVSKPKIFTLPDVAFVLQPSDRERLRFLLHSENLEKLKKPVIAVSVSALIARYGFAKVPEDQKVSHLITAMADVIKYYQEKLGASFVFIPHVIGEGNDDRIISRQIVNALKDRNDIYVIQGEYSHEDFKAFLAEYADLFIGARMHANIAAISVGVPTLALAYSQKTHGIIGEIIGLSNYIVDVRQVSDGDELLAEMISKIDMLWNCRDIVTKELTERMIEVKEKVWKNAEILRKEL